MRLVNYGGMVVSNVDVLGSLGVHGNSKVSVSRSGSMHVSGYFVGSKSSYVYLGGQHRFRRCKDYRSIMIAGYAVASHSYTMGVNSRGVSGVGGILFAGYVVGSDGQNVNVRGHSRNAIAGIVFSGVVMSYHFFSSM